MTGMKRHRFTVSRYINTYGRLIAGASDGLNRAMSHTLKLCENVMTYVNLRPRLMPRGVHSAGRVAVLGRQHELSG